MTMLAEVKTLTQLVDLLPPASRERVGADILIIVHARKQNTFNGWKEIDAGRHSPFGPFAIGGSSARIGALVECAVSASIAAADLLAIKFVEAGCGDAIAIGNAITNNSVQFLHEAFSDKNAGANQAIFDHALTRGKTELEIHCAGLAPRVRAMILDRRVFRFPSLRVSGAVLVALLTLIGTLVKTCGGHSEQATTTPPTKVVSTTKVASESSSSSSGNTVNLTINGVPQPAAPLPAK